MVLKRSNCSANSGTTMRLKAFRVYEARHTPNYNTLIKIVNNMQTKPTEGEKWPVDTAKEFIVDGLNDKDAIGLAPTWYGYYYNSVTYSLNKKKRWCLEDEICTAFAGDLAEQDFKVTFVKRESSCISDARQRGDVVAYYDSQHGPLPSVPKQHYSYRADLLHKARRTGASAVKKSRRRRFHNQHFRGVQRKAKIQRTHEVSEDTQDEQTAEEDKMPEIRYDVTVAQPLSAQILSRRWKRSYIYLTRKWWCRYDYGRNGSSHSGTAEEWYFLDYRMPTSAELAADDLEMYTEEEEHTDTALDSDLEEYYAPPPQEYSLLDFAAKTQRAKPNKKSPTKDTSVVNPATCQRVKKYGKGEAIFMCENSGSEGEESEDVVLLTDDLDSSGDSGHGSDTGVDSGHNVSGILNTVLYDTEFTKFDESFSCCEIPQTDLFVDAVRDKFGSAVEFGKCVPLTMVFSLSDAAAVLSENQTGLGRGPQPGEGDWQLVCQVAQVDSNNTDNRGTCAVNVRLHGNVDSEVVSAANSQLRDLMEEDGFSVVISLDSLLLQARDIVTTACSMHCKQESKKGQAGKQPNGVSANASAHLPHEQFVGAAYVCSLQEAYSHLADSEPMSVDPFEGNFTQFSMDGECSVCLTAMDEVSTSDNAFSVFVAMTACQHGFCRRCWQHHLVSGIFSGQTTLYCMEYKCRTAVDKATVMSLVPEWVLARWQHRVQNIAVETSGQWKWCPNAKCGLLARAPLSGGDRRPADGHSLPVECRCRRRWCLDCGLDAHWPLTCQQFDTYTKMMRQKGDEDGMKSSYSLIAFVKVKRCPGCHYPLEKNGGCSHMSCSQCQKSFCWVCLSDWEAHCNGGWTGCNERGEETLELDNSKVYPLPIECYKMAVAHRYAWKQLDREWRRKVASFVNCYALAQQTGKNSAGLSEDCVTCVLDALRFLKQAHVLQELVFVLLSNMRRSDQLARHLRQDLDVLMFTCTRVSQYMEYPPLRVLKCASELCKVTALGNNAVTRICRRAHSLRSKVKATAQEWLLKGDMEKYVRYK